MKFATARFSPASRKNVDRETDPGMPRKAPPAVAVCPRCRAIHRNGRWRIDRAEYARLTRKAGAAATICCPACRKISEGSPSGVVTLKGEFLRENREEILRLVRNEEIRARGIDPLERIMYVNEGEAWMELGTTDGKLARRIGRELRKACRGTVDYKWSKDCRLLRVVWVRES